MTASRAPAARSASALAVRIGGRAAGWPSLAAVAASSPSWSRSSSASGSGTVAIAPGDTLAILAHRLFGLDVGATWTPATETIVWDLRLPRVLTAMIVGRRAGGRRARRSRASSATRSPTRTCSGPRRGAALGAAIAVVIPSGSTILEFGLLQALAFVGALGAVFAVYRLSRIGGAAPLTSLLLTGYAVGSLLAAGLAMAMYLSGAALRQIFSYLLGGFDSAVVGPARRRPLPLVAGRDRSLILLRARSLERAAPRRGGGGPPRRRRPARAGDPPRASPRSSRRRAVAVSGLIGFVGLVVPHVVRLLVGPNARLVLPLAALGGRGPDGRSPTSSARLARRDPGRRRDRGHRRAVLPVLLRRTRTRATSCERADDRAPRRRPSRYRGRPVLRDVDLVDRAGRAGRPRRAERGGQVDAAPGDDRARRRRPPATVGARRRRRSSGSIAGAIARRLAVVPQQAAAAVRDPGRGGRRARPAAARGSVPRRPAGRPRRDRGRDRAGRASVTCSAATRASCRSASASSSCSRWPSPRRRRSSSSTSRPSTSTSATRSR